jgi:hypothetical protein
VTDNPTNSSGSTRAPDHTFTVADAYLEERRRLRIGVLAVILAAPFLILVFEPAGADRLFALAPFLLLFDAAVLAGSVLLQSYMSRQLRRMRLVVGAGGLVREAGTARDTVAWEDVTKVCVRHDRASIPTLIEVFRGRGGRLQLFGFDDMAGLASDLRMHIPNTAQYLTRNAIVVDTPAGRIIFVAGLLISNVALNLLFGRAVMGRLTGILALAMSVWMIGFRPTARTNPSLRFLDFVFGAFFLLSAWQMLGHWSR